VVRCSSIQKHNTRLCSHITPLLPPLLLLLLVSPQGHLPYMDRPLLVMAWLHELLLQRQSEGGLRMPAPILSRVYAVSWFVLWQPGQS
jgi:hypothetical protein